MTGIGRLHELLESKFPFVSLLRSSNLSVQNFRFYLLMQVMGIYIGSGSTDDETALVQYYPASRPASMQLTPTIPADGLCGTYSRRVRAFDDPP